MNIKITHKFDSKMHFKVLSSVLIIKEFRNNYMMVQLFVLIEVDGHVFIWNG